MLENTTLATGAVRLLVSRPDRATLQDFDIYSDRTGNNECQSFDIDQDTGILGDSGTTPPSAYFETPLGFIGNNVYAYASSCYHGVQEIYGFSRGGSGTLPELNTTPSIPAGHKRIGILPVSRCR
jgi:hypothetical protein